MRGSCERAPDAAQRGALAERCAAEPGPYRAPVFGTVPVLRSSAKSAASRPGHEASLLALLLALAVLLFLVVLVLLLVLVAVFLLLAVGEPRVAEPGADGQ